MGIFYRVICLLIGYLFGNISPGTIISNIKNKDIRNEGSGNPGSTNVSRTLGFKFGLLCLVFDCLKAFIPAVLVGIGFGNAILATYAAFGAVVGHIFPVFLGFKGGKGIASSVGLLLAIWPICLPALAIPFLLIVIITRYVSLGSVIAAIGLIVVSTVGIVGRSLPLEIGIIFSLDAALCILRHKDNIKRLLAGEENKFSLKRKEKSDGA